MFQAKDKFKYLVYCIDWVDLTTSRYSICFPLLQQTIVQLRQSTLQSARIKLWISNFLSKMFKSSRTLLLRLENKFGKVIGLWTFEKLDNKLDIRISIPDFVFQYWQEAAAVWYVSSQGWIQIPGVLYWLGWSDYSMVQYLFASVTADNHTASAVHTSIYEDKTVDIQLFVKMFKSSRTIFLRLENQFGKVCGLWTFEKLDNELVIQISIRTLFPNTHKKPQQFGMFQAEDKFKYLVYCIDWVDLTTAWYSICLLLLQQTIIQLRQSTLQSTRIKLWISNFLSKCSSRAEQYFWGSKTGLGKYVVCELLKNWTTS